MPATKDISISKGHSYTTVLRWETQPIVRVPIQTVTCPAGAARIKTNAVHGIPEGWRCAIVNVLQPADINANDPNDIQADEYFPATVIDTTTVELNDLNIAWMPAYTSGGFLQFNTPMNLTGVSVRMRLWTRKGGTLLASNQVADGALNVLVTTIDTTKKTITLNFPVAATALLAGKSGWYDVEAIGADASVTPLVSGNFIIERE